MRSQFIVLLVVGLVASSYAYHLSDAKKRSTQTEARLFNLLGDLYAKVVYPPLNHIVTNLALLGAQVLAGVAQTGIPAPNGRMIHLSDRELRSVIDKLWNQSLKPHFENALQGLSQVAAQLLAGFNINGINLSSFLGRSDLTDEEARGFDSFLNSLADSLGSVFTNVIQKPLEEAISSVALMGAQALAGIGTNGISLSSIFGKRDLTDEEARGLDSFLDLFVNSLGNVFSQVIQKPLEEAISNVALMGAQALAGIGTNGISLSSIFGKRDLSEFASRQAEARGFFDSLGQGILNGLQGVWTNVLQNPLEQAISTAALMGAQALAGIGVNGINLGKRQLDNDARGEVIDNLVNHANGLYQNQVKPVVENALNGAILHLAGVLANLSQTLGRR
jgi:Na+-transporting NADH:ubiquinone oxidoreductase subunit NqrD